MQDQSYRNVQAMILSAMNMLGQAARQCDGIPDRRILVSQIDACISQAKAARACALSLFEQRKRDQSDAGLRIQLATSTAQPEAGELSTELQSRLHPIA
jgi:hypothetical protein